MTAYTVAGKRRARKGKRAMFAVEQAREVESKLRIVEIDDPPATVRQARSRQTGLPETEVMHAMIGEDAGRAIALEAKSKDEANRLWSEFAKFDQAEWVYFARVIGRPRFPAVSKLEFAPERFETRPDDRPDLRTTEQKITDAKNAWQYWTGLLGCLRTFERDSIIRASWQMDELHDCGSATSRGRAFVAAMRELVRVIDNLNNPR